MLEQHDDHIWLTVAGEAWAIERVVGSVIVLWRGYEPELEWATFDVTGMDWQAYTEAAIALLAARRTA